MQNSKGLQVTPKLLVILISSGENELSECKAAIDEQNDINFEVFHIKDKSNKEAHEICYNTIMANSDSFTHFVKVDADMVFISNTKLSEMIKVFLSDPDLDHAAFSVFDWASQKAIIGMNVFSNRCYWINFDDNLFVDPLPSFPGKRKLFWSGVAPVALHSSNPSIKQAIQFGCHRALKILQRDRRIPNLNRANFQFDLMYQVYQQFLLEPDEKRIAVLFGVESVFSREHLKVLDSKDNPLFIQLTREFDETSQDTLKENINNTWGIQKTRINFFFNFMKMKLWMRFVFFKAIQKLNNMIIRNHASMDK
jgi:hypothetical protein